MQQLSPFEQFLIHRTLVDPSSTDVNYVRATIRDADDTLIDTVDLTDRGGQRFSKNWKVCADKTINGSGRYISITTNVYTDSGYTTLSSVDGQESQTYIVQRRLDSNTVFGGSGGVIDYREIAKIVAEEIKKLRIPEPQKLEFPKQIDFTPAIKEVAKSIADKIDKIRIPEPKPPEKIDFRPLERGMENLSKEIRNLPRFEKTKIDLSPILKEIQNLKSETKDAIQETDNTQKDLVKYFEKNKSEFISGLIESMADRVIEKTKIEEKKKARNDYFSKLRMSVGL